jgi:hypothetical protein
MELSEVLYAITLGHSQNPTSKRKICKILTAENSLIEEDWNRYPTFQMFVASSTI